MEMKQMYDSKSFDLTSNMDEEMMIEFYVDKEIEIDIYKKYLNEIKNFIKDVYENADESQLDNMQIEFLLKSKFKNIDTSILVEEQNSIFRLIDSLINNYYMFKESDTYILKNTFNLYKNSSFCRLEDIGKKIDISGERVRQKRVSLFEKLGSNLQFFKNFNENKNLIEIMDNMNIFNR